MASNHQIAFEVAYGMAGEHVARNVALWGSTAPLAARNEAAYKMPSVSRLVSSYSSTIQVAHHVGWGSLQTIATRHEDSYEDAAVLSSRLESPYHLLSSYQVRNQLKYRLLDGNPRQVSHRLGYSLLNAALVFNIDNNPTIMFGTTEIQVDDVELSCDEGSSVWSARFRVLKAEDFARLPILGVITMALSLPSGTENFVFFIDSKNVSRPFGDLNCSVSALSPLAMLDSPYANTSEYINQQPVSALSLVTSLIGSVDWALPDWVIPSAGASFSGVSPLGAAKAILESVGGVIESLPDGSVLCRKKYPVDVDKYSLEDTDHAFFDDEIHDVTGQYGFSSLFNRLILSNEDSSAQSQDTLETVEDPDHPNDGTKKIVRGYLHTPRPVTLAHTGNPLTQITPLGERVRWIEEVIEFKDGHASVQYKLDSIDFGSCHWQHVNLGSVSFAGNSLVSSVAGNSLYAIKYSVRSLDWAVELDLTEEVQFVLLD